MDGQPAVAVLEVHAGALLQEELGHLHVAVRGRDVQLHAHTRTYEHVNMPSDYCLTRRARHGFRENGSQWALACEL